MSKDLIHAWVKAGMVRRFQSNPRTCLACDRVFSKPESSRNVTCSKKCMGILNKELYALGVLKSHTSLIHRPWDGGKRPEFAGAKHPMFGKHHAEEALAKMKLTWFRNGFSGPHPGARGVRANTGRTCFKRGTYTGPQNRNWKGGITSLRSKIRGETFYNDCRKSVFHRDDYTCRSCGKRGGKLNAHHVVTFMTLITKYAITDLGQAVACAAFWDASNGKTLCVSCHKAVHRKTP